MGVGLYLIANFFRIYVMINFLGVFYVGQKVKDVKKWTHIILFFIVCSGLHLLFANPFLNLATNTFFVFFATFNYKGKISNRALSTFMLCAVCMIIDSLIYSAFYNLDNLSHFTIITNLLSVLMLYTFYLIVDKLQSGFRAQKLDLMHWMAIITIPISSMMLVIIAYSEDYGSVACLLIAFLLLFINIVVFYLFDIVSTYYQERGERDLLKQQNAAYANQMEIIQETQNHMRILRHDFKNHYLTMQSLLEWEKTDTLKNYITELYDYIHPEIEYVNTGNTEIDCILNYKLHRIKLLGAEMKVSVKIPTRLGISPVDLNILLGNLLDNSIEALSNTKDKYFSLDIFYDRGVLYLDMINSYRSKPIFENGKFTTLKEDRTAHGLGLTSIDRTVENYNGHIDITWTDELFTVSVMLYSKI